MAQFKKYKYLPDSLLSKTYQSYHFNRIIISFPSPFKLDSENAKCRDNSQIKILPREIDSIIYLIGKLNLYISFLNKRAAILLR